MSLYRRFERILSWLAPPHFLFLLLTGQVITFYFLKTGQVIPEQLFLSGKALQAGEGWRLMTFLVYPMSLSPLWFAIGIGVTWFMGTALEGVWGKTRFFAFVMLAVLATLLACWIFPAEQATNLYINGAFTLAFARFYPEVEFRLFFVLPVKVKYLAWLAWAGYTLSLILFPWSSKAMILAGILPHFVFFGKDMLHDLRARGRRREFHKITKSGANMPLHTCSICGKNSSSHPELEFRYRSGSCICERCLPEVKS